MKLNREQIRQILENCIEGECHGACPLFLEGQYCIDVLAPNVLKAFAEFTKELEDWKAIAEGYQRQFEEARADTVREAIARIEEKAESCDLYVANSHKPIDTIYQISKTLLDQIALEMLEGK